MTRKCFECGAAHPDDKTCRDDFHKMLELEVEDPKRGTAHSICAQIVTESLGQISGPVVVEREMQDAILAPLHIAQEQDIKTTCSAELISHLSD